MDCAAYIIPGYDCAANIYPAYDCAANIDLLAAMALTWSLVSHSQIVFQTSLGYFPVILSSFNPFCHPTCFVVRNAYLHRVY